MMASFNPNSISPKPCTAKALRGTSSHRCHKQSAATPARLSACGAPPRVRESMSGSRRQSALGGSDPASRHVRFAVRFADLTCQVRCGGKIRAGLLRRPPAFGGCSSMYPWTTQATDLPGRAARAGLPRRRTGSRRRARAPPSAGPPSPRPPAAPPCRRRRRRRRRARLRSRERRTGLDVV